MSHSNSGEIIWRCKIGGPGFLQGGGNDLPMRQAIARAYREITGFEPEFIFSGWGAELTEPERAVVEDREPAPAGDYHGGRYVNPTCLSMARVARWLAAWDFRHGAGEESAYYEEMARDLMQQLNEEE